MSTVRQKLKFETVGDIDAGALRVEFNKQLNALIQDLHDRPYLEKPRVLVLKLGMKPVPDKQSSDGSLGEIDFAWEIDHKSPKRGSAMTVMAAQNDGTLAFVSDIPDAGDDPTLLDEMERKRVEREERARASAAASADQVAVENQAIDGR